MLLQPGARRSEWRPESFSGRREPWEASRRSRHGRAGSFLKDSCGEFYVHSRSHRQRVPARLEGLPQLTHLGELGVVEQPEGVALRRWQARDHRLIELGNGQRRRQRTLTIEDANDVLRDDRLERHSPARTRFGEIVDIPPGGDQPKKGLIEAEHAFDGAVREIVCWKEWVLFAPGARAVRPHAGKCRRTVASFLQLNQHGLGTGSVVKPDRLIELALGSRPTVERQVTYSVRHQQEAL